MKVFDLSHCDEWISELKAGDRILISGTVYTARDAVHKKWRELYISGHPLPISPRDLIIYYAGPTPAVNGMPIGSCGPTTSQRMDPYYSELADMGMKITIGKGNRSKEVREKIKSTGGIYLCAVGGAGALYASHIVSSEVVAYPELGCESMKRLCLHEFPVYIGVDSHGNSIFSGEEK